MTARDPEDADLDDDGWADVTGARRPGVRDALKGAGLAMAAGLLIVLAGAGAVVALLVVSLRPSHRDGPGDGRHSRGLPVVVTPASNLSNGATVEVRASRLASAGQAVIAMCEAEAETHHRGVASCDLAHRSEDPVERGQVRASLRVVRSIQLPGGRRVDCASDSGRCVVMVASIENYDRSGFAPLAFLPGAG